MAKSYKQVAVKYAKDIVSGKRIAGTNVIEGCQRFLADLQRKDIKFDSTGPDFIIGIIEKIMVHKQGEDLDGKSLVGKPLELQDWQIFIVFNLVGFYLGKTDERRFKEAFIFVPRKNGKTMFIAALAFALSLWERRSGSKIYITSASLKQASQSFDDVVFTLRRRKMIDQFRVIDNHREHIIQREWSSGGSVYIEAVAANPDAQDSFNCNIAIADEIHAFKKAAQYNRFKEAMKAYTNKLMIGITTAGDNMNSFCYRRLEYARKVLNGTVKDDSLFCFVACADQDENGDVDYLNPIQHEKANPSYGVTIRPEDLMHDAEQAQNDPQQRKDFLSRSLNVYTTAMKAYFNIEEFRRSDQKYNYTLEELAKLPVEWYGGADLSKMHDLTAAALFGHYDREDLDIIITHAFFPVVNAAKKADEDGIPEELRQGTSGGVGKEEEERLPGTDPSVALGRKICGEVP